MVILEQAGSDEEELLVVLGLIYTYIYTMALSPIHDHARRTDALYAASSKFCCAAALGPHELAYCDICVRCIRHGKKVSALSAVTSSASAPILQRVRRNAHYLMRLKTLQPRQRSRARSRHLTICKLSAKRENS